MDEFTRLVCEVIRRFPGLSRTHLVKLVYLTDREYFKKIITELIMGR